METNAHHPQSESQWWLASDGRWYPPELRPGLLPSPPAEMTALPPSAYWLHHHSSIAVDDVVPEDAGTRWSTRHTVVVVLCVLYVISPVDLLPEVILGPFGLADDGLALVFATFAALLGLRADSAERSDER